MRDNGFNKLCPSGNIMVDGFKRMGVKDSNDYQDLREEQDRDELIRETED